jgi:hypothetical protein
MHDPDLLQLVAEAVASYLTSLDDWELVGDFEQRRALGIAGAVLVALGEAGIDLPERSDGEAGV